MRAFCLIREQPHYRRDAFITGLQAIGYEVICKPPTTAEPGDLLAIWNRYGANELLADRFDACPGAHVIVAENGYVKGRHDGGDYYAIAKSYHNGCGQWPSGGPERWDALGISMRDWRTRGEHVLIAPNRSFGARGAIMPRGWEDNAARRIQAICKRRIVLRPHPANGTPKTPLADDLKDCWCVVIWSSSVGVSALIEGIPVVCEAPYWICKQATVPQIGSVENEDWKRQRYPAMRSLAWAQFSVAEITSGWPFQRLLNL